MTDGASLQRQLGSSSPDPSQLKRVSLMAVLIRERKKERPKGPLFLLSLSVEGLLSTHKEIRGLSGALKCQGASWKESSGGALRGHSQVRQGGHHSGGRGRKRCFSSDLRGPQLTPLNTGW